MIEKEHFYHEADFRGKTACAFGAEATIGSRDDVETGAFSAARRSDASRNLVAARVAAALNVLIFSGDSRGGTA